MNMKPILYCIFLIGLAIGASALTYIDVGVNLLHDGNNINTSRKVTIYYFEDDGVQPPNPVQKVIDTDNDLGVGKNIQNWALFNGKSLLYFSIGIYNPSDITISVDGFDNYTISGVTSSINPSMPFVTDLNLTPFSLPDVLINEFESNPSGTDSGNEWVELYNAHSTAVDLSGWELVNNDGGIEAIPAGTILESGEYLVYTFSSSFLDNSDEGIILRNGGYESDSTIIENDASNTDECWARIPNAVDTDNDADWAFQACTKGWSNDDKDNDGYDSDNDCNDADANINPGETELCNGLDDDCDTETDEDYNVGNACSVGIGECAADGVFVCSVDGLNTECDATAGTPIDETCDGKDNDCDGAVDNNLDVPDADNQDGVCFGSLKVCDGINGWLEPDYSLIADYESTESTCDSLDNDCDNSIDEELLTTYYQDSDTDNYGDSASTTDACSLPDGYVTDNTDCDDSDGDVNPIATEVCDNGIDDDCDGDIDSADDDCQVCDPGVETKLCSNQVGVCNGAEQTCNASGQWSGCDDADYTANNGNYEANESTCDSLDNDCDNSIDEELLTTYYQDSDTDNYGDLASTTDACSLPAGYVTDNTDCDDNDAEKNPGETETCDGKDNNCDTVVDEEDATGCTVYYYDGDDDFYGIDDSKCLCSTEGKYDSDNTDDCDDSDGNVNPGEKEDCSNGIDDDCDGDVDDADSDCFACIPGNVTACGTGVCAGTKTCQANGKWGDCSTSGNDGGVCALCDANGNQVYDATQDSDCDSNDISGVDACDDGSDGNPFTYDYYAGFDSECSAVGTCTTDVADITHDCDIDNCGAECEADSDCAVTECDNLDGCYNGVYRDYADVDNGCTNGCACEDNACTVYTEDANNPECGAAADANGPYECDEGDTITLDSTGSVSKDGTITDYLWDLDNDGEFDDATGASPSYDCVDDYDGNIRLKVIDSNGKEGIDETSLIVNNVDPDANIDSAPAEGDVGVPVSFEGSATDVPADVLTFNWDFGDGESDEGEDVSHTYDEAGEYNVTLTVTDDDTGSDVVTHDISVYTEMKIPIDDGVSMFSLPLKPKVPVSWNDIEENCILDWVAYYDTPTGTYVQDVAGDDNLILGQGYFASVNNTDGKCRIVVRGMPFDYGDGYNGYLGQGKLVAGWNMVGAASKRSHVYYAAGDCYAPFRSGPYIYNPLLDPPYELSDFMEPGKAYWIELVSGECNFNGYAKD